ncbi:hypothetical protein [Haladaptatus sp. ZSTT2]|uniref:hypothetical protein n=1 Tax=Haladaptatus sp. ZSTT2 TaxID=3120515 RepID=UPI00300F3FF1
MPRHTDDLTAPLVPHIHSDGEDDREPTQTDLYEQLAQLQTQLDQLETDLRESFQC